MLHELSDNLTQLHEEWMEGNYRQDFFRIHCSASLWKDIEVLYHEAQKSYSVCFDGVASFLHSHKGKRVGVSFYCKDEKLSHILILCKSA